jgi:hypothetical protein
MVPWLIDSGAFQLVSLCAFWSARVSIMIRLMADARRKPCIPGLVLTFGRAEQLMRRAMVVQIFCEQRIRYDFCVFTMKIPE